MWSLRTGQGPRLFLGPTSCIPMFRGLFPAVDHPSMVSSVDGIVDASLALVFQDLQHLVLIINHHFSSNTMLPGNVFQSTMGSIQSQLLGLHFDLESDLASECIRLGMLAFLSTFFRLPVRNLQYEWLAGRFRTACQTMDVSATHLRGMTFWVLMVGAISVFDLDEPWLAARMSEAADGIESWQDATGSLKRLMWVTCIHDSLGRKAFETLLPGPSNLPPSSSPDDRVEFVPFCRA